MTGLSKKELSQVLNKALNARDEELKERVAEIVNERNGESLPLEQLPTMLLTLSGKIAAVMMAAMADALVEVIATNNEALLSPPSTPEQ